jgi:hypothetical protein
MTQCLTKAHLRRILKWTSVFNSSLAKPKQNANEIFQNYELFIYGVTHDITNFRILWKCVEISNNQIQVVNCIFNKFLLLS